MSNIAVSDVERALSSFSLSHVLGVAAQRAIVEMRKRLQAHVGRLPKLLLL